MPMAYESRMLIDGKLVEASGGATYDNINPATEAVIGPVADANAADMESAIAAARRAFDETSWSTDPAFRKACLVQLKDALAKLINQHNATSELLLWLAKERSDAYADILGPEVFRAMQLRGMKKRFGWHVAAKRYVEVYGWALERRGARA